MNFKTLTAVFVVVSTLSGCSFLHRNTVGLFSDDPVDESEHQLDVSPQPTEKRTTRVPVQGRDAAVGEELAAEGDVVEVLWKIPEHRAESFILRYGFSEDALNFTVELEESEVEKYDHPTFGYVYRYAIPDIPADQRAYVTLQTKVGDVVSEPTQIFEAAGE